MSEITKKALPFMKKYSEAAFETALEEALINGGYLPGDSKTFDAELAIFPPEVLTFIQETQPKQWQRIKDHYKERADTYLLESLSKELSSKGALEVLRYGFKCFGKILRLAYFTPNTSRNGKDWEQYQKNRLSVYRQVHFSIKKPNLSLDVVLAVNGLPVVTLELKNSLTGQTVAHAKRQYKKDRSPREPIFRFKERALVHFAVDTEEVAMTTQLKEDDTFFLPFNKGYKNGAGNPPDPYGNYRTAYLWEKVLQKDSLLDILARFMHLEVKETKVSTPNGIKTKISERMIFPRYHQLDAVRKLLSNARENGSGHNYLIQHSAGSGKSNSIAWLSHRLANLHNEQDEKIFDSVIVITDRRVLDDQLQKTIYQFDHKAGVVQPINEDTQQLAKALSDSTPIIITTIQKFPFIAQALQTMEKKGEKLEIDTAGKKFAVIVDEAHSSQSGETAMELRKVLNQEGIASAVAEQMLEGDDEEEGNLTEETRKQLYEEMLKRPKQLNLSFFAFTATPKFKTKLYFNEPGPDGQAPFHLYSMRQAIEEGFILDVLENYTTYKTYFGLIKKVEDDPEVPKSKAAKALARFMSLHPSNIGQKVEIIIEHFRLQTLHKIGGRAKAMVVTGSRLHAVRYKLAFDAYIKKKGYQDIKSLVAFSGSVHDPDIPESNFTEVEMNNGVKEKELPQKFETDEYQVLLVAEKYQTGFDQPLLHTMYVDKRLAGIQAVQTLSRLNRTAPGKEDTFVLDFVNNPEDIYQAFKPYFEKTDIGEVPDPHQLEELKHKIIQWQVFSLQEVNAFTEVWFSNKAEHGYHDHKKLDNVLGIAKDRFEDLPEADQELFKSQVTSFVRLYGFLSQIIPYQDSDLEKHYIYLRYLLTKLPREEGERFQLSDEVALKYIRIQKISEGSINLKEGEADPLKGPTEVGTGKAKDEQVTLSLLVDKLNDRFGTEFTPADQLYFDQVKASAISNEALVDAAKVNSYDNWKDLLKENLPSLMFDRLEGNEELVKKTLNNENIMNVVATVLGKEIFNQINRNS